MPVNSSSNWGKAYRSIEDAAFHILDPKVYEELEHQVAPLQAEDTQCLKILQKAARGLLQRNNIKGSVQGRIKSLYSLHCKMARKGVSLETIMDRVGLRIIVSSVPECYQVLGLLHAHFQPVPGTFMDYIGLPKENGYQSLHTCVYPFRDISHKNIEFQIRTELMHREAEYGEAAHWKYKEGTGSILTGNQAKSPGHEAQSQQQPIGSPAFIKILCQQMAAGHIVIFGNSGHKVWLPENATVEHYLRKTNRTLSPPPLIKVNSRTVALGHILKDADTIEVIAPGKVPRQRSLSALRPRRPSHGTKEPTSRGSAWKTNTPLESRRQFTSKDPGKRRLGSTDKKGGTAHKAAERSRGRDMWRPGPTPAARLFSPDLKRRTVQ
ncbi:MAG: hypothetical protein RI601_02735 [Desulfurivibrionaceae bacterium]|nr:hypothetical protein [Desulfurivibrionaceae bacterium]